MGGVEIGALTILVSVMVWYFKYQTKRQAIREDKQDEERATRQEKRDEEQKEERDYYRNLITHDMEKFHEADTKNIDLNNQSLVLQKDMIKSQAELAKLIESVDRKINGQKE